MNKIAILYVQTSGVQKNYEASIYETDKWVRAISINWQVFRNPYANLYAEDPCYGKCNNIIPSGFIVDEESLLYNSITLDELVNSGKNIIDVLKDFLNDIKDVDFIIGHNIQFHLNVIKSELIRNGFNELKEYKSICLMKIGADYCKIPNKTGYKFPTLNELSVNVLKEEINSEEFYKVYSSDMKYNLKVVIDIYEELYLKGFINASGFEPSFMLKHLKLPIKYGEFKEKFKITHTNNQNDKIDVFLNDNLIYDNLNNLECFEKYKLYLGEKTVIINNVLEIKYFIFDYRGVLVIEVLNEILRIYYGYIYIDFNAVLSVIEYDKGFFINGYSSKYYGNKDEIGAIRVFYHESCLKFIFSKKNKKILFENDNSDFLFNEYSGIIIRKKQSEIDFFNFEGDFLYAIQNNFEIINFIPKSDYIVIRRNNECEVFDILNNLTILSSFQNFISFHEYGLFLIKRNDEYLLINKKSKLFYRDFKDFNFEIEFDLIIISFVDNSFKKLFNFKGELIFEGFINTIKFTGQFYSESSDYPIYKLSQKDKVDLLIHNKKHDVNLCYDKAQIIDTDIIDYVNEGFFGLYNVKNKFFIKPIYNKIMKFCSDGNQYYYLKIKSELGKIINSTGGTEIDNIDCKCIFNRYDAEYIMINNNNNLYDLYNFKKKEIVLFNFLDISRLFSTYDMFKVVNNNKAKFINFTNNKETEFVYDKEFNTNVSLSSQYISLLYDRLIVTKNSKFGFLNEELSEQIECVYDFAEPFALADNDEVLAKVKLNNQDFFIDIFGNKKLI